MARLPVRFTDRFNYIGFRQAFQLHRRLAFSENQPMGTVVRWTQPIRRRFTQDLGTLGVETGSNGNGFLWIEGQ